MHSFYLVSLSPACLGACCLLSPAPSARRPCSPVDSWQHAAVPPRLPLSPQVLGASGPARLHVSPSFSSRHPVSSGAAGRKIQSCLSYGRTCAIYAFSTVVRMCGFFFFFLMLSLNPHLFSTPSECSLCVKHHARCTAGEERRMQSPPARNHDQGMRQLHYM